MKSKYTITMEYTERTEYTVKLDPDGDPVTNEYYPSAGDVIDHWEDDPKYIVNETSYYDDGSVASYDSLDVFDTYKEAKDYVKELEAKENNK